MTPPDIATALPHPGSTQARTREGRTQPPGTRPWFQLWGPDRPLHRRHPIIDSAEVHALLKHAAEQGLDSDDGLLVRLYRALADFDEDPASFTRIERNGQEIAITNAELILADYARLSKLTGGVHGRNLLNARHLPARTRPFMLSSFVIFVLSIVSLAYGAWIAAQPAAAVPLVPPLAVHMIQYFAPFLWGALGSCVYILKRISDEAAANRFDTDRFQGWLTRALLGAILGGTITYVVDQDAFGTVSISMTALAFLTGLGTKVVYGALERLISLLAEKFNLDAVARDRSKIDPVAEFLAREISATNPDSDRGRYDVLVTLLNARRL